MNKWFIFIFATVLYGVIDIAWNVSPAALKMYEVIHEYSGTDLSFQREQLTDVGFGGLLAVLLFFGLIGYGNQRFAIVPGIEARSLKKALSNSFVLGCAAYATYIVPVFLIVDGWPLVLVPIDILIGGLLSLSTSAIITSIGLRRARRAA